MHRAPELAMTRPMTLTVAAAYREKLQSGEINPDAAQALAVEALSRWRAS